MSPAAPSSPPNLISARLLLRELTVSDAPALLEWLSDPAVMRYWSHPPITQLEHVYGLMRVAWERHQQGTVCQWGIEHRATERLIGTCTLYEINREHRRASIGYALVRDAWGQGFAREAVSLALEFAFEQLGLRRVEADVDPRNTASIKLLLRLGFKQEGVLRARYQVAGEIQDSVILGLVPSLDQSAGE